jgi:hypothetical protein
MCEAAVKENNGEGWSFDDMEGGDRMEMWLSGEESDQYWDDFFITVEGESRAIQRGWTAMVVQI